MQSRPDNFATTWSATGADTDGGGVTVTKAAPGDTNKRHIVTDIECSGDKAALVTIESPSGTILYRKRFAAAFTLSERFTVPVKAAIGQAVLVKIDDGTANTEANIQGYTVP